MAIPQFTSMQDISGKRVFIRADLNVPQDEQGRITDDSRIRASLLYLRRALEEGDAIAHSTAFSIAGGAFLEFLEGKELPAVAILEERGTRAVSTQTEQLVY